MKAFLDKVGNVIVAFLTWFKSLPIAKPLLALAYSRKALISVALVGFMLKVFPDLAPVENELTVVLTQVVVIAIVAIAHQIGIALEDVAEKRPPSYSISNDWRAG